jgi:hypothetical protein
MNALLFNFWSQVVERRGPVARSLTYYNEHRGRLLPAETGKEVPCRVYSGQYVKSDLMVG